MSDIITYLNDDSNKIASSSEDPKEVKELKPDHKTHDWLHHCFYSSSVLFSVIEVAILG